MMTLHRCLRTVKSTRVRILALALMVPTAVLLPSLPGLSSLGIGRVVASVRGLLGGAKGAQVTGEQHIVHIPYFTTSYGMTSILTLNNNMTQEASATITLFNVKGQSVVLSSINLRPMLPTRFDIAELLDRTDFSSGNVQIAFNGI